MTVLGEAAKLYDGSLREDRQRPTTGVRDLGALRSMVNGNLTTLRAVAMRERMARDKAAEERAFQKRMDKADRERLREDLRYAKAELRRVKCDCRKCSRYRETVATWAARMRDQKGKL